MLKIALGTKSNYKINAVQKVLGELEIEAEIILVDVETGVSEQPKAKDETITGSMNRAKAALKATSNAEIGLGIEFGYEPFGSEYRMVCWASIVDSSDLEISEHSSSLQLPKKLKDALDADISVDTALEEFYAELPKGEASRHMVEYVRKRRIIYECVENVMMRYIFRDLY